MSEEQEQVKWPWLWRALPWVYSAAWMAWAFYAGYKLGSS